MTVVTEPERAAPTTPPSRPPAWQAALAGAVAAGVALAVTELVGALASRGPSLITAVGSRFIDRTAGTLKDVAINLFGTNDKAALITGIVVLSLLAGAILGVASVERRWIGAVGFAAFGAVGVLAGVDTPLTSTVAIVFAALVGSAAGIGVLLWLLRLATRGQAADEPATHVTEDPRVKTPDRRTFLYAAAGTAALAVVATAASRGLRSRRTVSRGTTDVALPSPKTSVPVPASQPFQVDGLSPYITPNADFYRIDTALLVPQVDAASWTVDITGMVDRPLTFSYDDLLGMDLVQQPVTLSCVSNEVGGDLVGNAVWLGVPLPALLERAGVQSGATQIVGRSVDGFTVGFPTDVALDGRVALVAVGMNGEPLPVVHGFPARLVVAGLYGYVSATKWLKEIELTRLEDFDAYWVPRGWAKEAPIKTESRIDVPRGGAALQAGSVNVAGVAWAPTRGISAVELQVDDGPWQPAELGAVASKNTWALWRFVWDATPGDHQLSVRATDDTGATQTAEVRPPPPDGATGYHVRRVTVT
jgi:DMSO/TMAO reductase YedYZ molybdopterin-dependent catalytic subunit